MVALYYSGYTIRHRVFGVKWVGRMMYENVMGEKLNLCGIMFSFLKSPFNLVTRTNFFGAEYQL